MDLNENWKTQLSNKDENAKKKQEELTLEVKFESNKIIQEISDCGNADSATIRETLGRQLEELNEV